METGMPINQTGWSEKGGGIYLFSSWRWWTNEMGAPLRHKPALGLYCVKARECLGCEVFFIASAVD